jgi:methylmalonyl-CoA mutase cobalamin-binding domain/chain
LGQYFPDNVFQTRVLQFLLAGAHLKPFPAVPEELKKANAEDIKVLGGGIILEDDVECLFRGAKITEIYAGASEVQRLLIAVNLLK